MNIIFFALLVIGVIIPANSRLIEKITERTLTTVTKAGSSPPVRLTRHVRNKHGLASLSEDENGFKDKVIAPIHNSKRSRRFVTPKISAATLPKLSRQNRNYGRFDRATKNATPSIPPAAPTQKSKSKAVLVKKPIPKYNDRMEYDDDFQMKVNRTPIKVIESGEHEDEDFNINDYEFDVNHDDYVGRGRPLEPRVKPKETQYYPEAMKQERKSATVPSILKPEVAQESHQVPSNKKERSAKIPKKTGEKDDYYYDTVTSSKAQEKPRELDDEFNEENEESKEDYNRMSTVRLARSPWNVKMNADKFGDKGSAAVTNVLSILPMFPEVPIKDEDYVFHS